MITKFKAFVVVASLLAVSLFGGNARSMPILDFVKMNNDDEATYVTSLVEGAAKLLRAQGKPDPAQRAITLFKDSSKSGGLNQLVLNLRTLNALNNRNAINPNNRAPVYDVEDAMEQTLKDNGIVVSIADLRTINQDFRQAGPNRPHLFGQ